ncbi:Aldehyde oxidase GLOX [Camellia lanceoleosa]|uniref:Aldehyde oxidase GLOX n=1 Tax=Camellia lanceoleosa TaxID=1840588 RepID=A0ACC0FXF6_9ERIC|nr:Aldehyde oxidase GLOX [Camellia lanceoleosa]
MDASSVKTSSHPHSASVDSGVDLGAAVKCDSVEPIVVIESSRGRTNGVDRFVEVQIEGVANTQGNTDRLGEFKAPLILSEELAGTEVDPLTPIGQISHHRWSESEDLDGNRSGCLCSPTIVFVVGVDATGQQINVVPRQRRGWIQLFCVANANIASMHTAVTRFNTVVLLDRTNIGPSHKMF